MPKEETKKNEQVEVSFKDLTDIDPTDIKGKAPNMEYRFINQRLAELRRRQGYIPVDTQKEGIKVERIIEESGKSADTTLKYMDTVLYKRPKELQELAEKRKKEKLERMKRNLSDWYESAKKDFMSGDTKKIKKKIEEFNEVNRI